MKKHSINREEPKDYFIPRNIPAIPKVSTVMADPAWVKNQTGGSGRYGSALNHYNLTSLERIKAMPVQDFVADDAHLYLWVTNSNIDEGLEVIKAWGFRYITMFHWIKPRMGMGNYLRNASETCLFAVRGKLPPLNRNQINWLISYPTEHSEKPREFVSIVERVSPGPYLELFCRKRPASNKKWYCWGDETEGGADIFIPGYPVPKYSFLKDGEEEKSTSSGGISAREDAGRGVTESTKDLGVEDSKPKNEPSSVGKDNA